MEKTRMPVLYETVVCVVVSPLWHNCRWERVHRIEDAGGSHLELVTSDPHRSVGQQRSSHTPQLLVRFGQAL